jgi:hypothetical protein
MKCCGALRVASPTYGPISRLGPADRMCQGQASRVVRVPRARALSTLAAATTAQLRLLLATERKVVCPLALTLASLPCHLRPRHWRPVARICLVGNEPVQLFGFPSRLLLGRAGCLPPRARRAVLGSLSIKCAGNVNLIMCWG